MVKNKQESNSFDIKNIRYSKINTHVNNSYFIKDRELIKKYVMIIIEERKKLNYPVTRTVDSYVREWIGHNKLCSLGIFRRRTKDVDLNEINTFISELAWKILSK